MSVKTTIEIQRYKALNRIKVIRYLIEEKNYRKIEEITNESEENLEDFVNYFYDEILCEGKDDNNYDYFTNSMLEDLLNTPFFRLSEFENYTVLDKIEEK